MHPLQPEKTDEYALQNLLFLLIFSGLISDLLFKSMFCWKKDWDSTAPGGDSLSSDCLRACSAGSKDWDRLLCWKKGTGTFLVPPSTPLRSSTDYRHLSLSHSSCGGKARLAPSLNPAIFAGTLPPLPSRAPGPPRQTLSHSLSGAPFRSLRFVGLTSHPLSLPPGFPSHPLSYGTFGPLRPLR